MLLAAPPHVFSLFVLSTFRPHSLSAPHTLFFRRKLRSLSPSSPSSLFPDDDYVVGDCLVFEDGVFDDPYLQNEVGVVDRDANKNRIEGRKTNRRSRAKRRDEHETEQENLVPEEWRDVQAEVNLTKKERRKIAQQLESGVRVEKKKQGMVPLRNLDLQEYLAYKEAKFAQLKPLVLDKPSSFPHDDGESSDYENGVSSSSERVTPKNPRWAAYGKGFDHVTQFFNGGNYEPGGKKSDGPRKLFTKEEKVLLNSRIPDLAVVTSASYDQVLLRSLLGLASYRKWLPLHTLAASGEFYLVDSLLKHNVDINAADENGLTALHRAITGKKQAITNYLLRESANPFVLDEEGATLMHYAVQTASAPTIKLLLLYNVDINGQDIDGWTPLHVAVQARRIDIVKLLLIKGANRTSKNKDGLTPLDLCLYSGRETRTYELIKLLKEIPGKRKAVQVSS